MKTFKSRCLADNRIYESLHYQHVCVYACNLNNFTIGHCPEDIRIQGKNLKASEFKEKIPNSDGEIKQK